MADNPLPPLRDNATMAEVTQWLNKEVRPRVTKESAIQWLQIDGSTGSVEDLAVPETPEAVAARETGAAHIAADQAHGASGDIVGANDRPTSVTGGSVLLAASVGNISASTVSPGGSYSQAEAVAVANQAKAASDKIDALLAALRTSGVLES